MNSAAISWGRQLTRRGTAPAPWLAGLVQALGQVLLGGCSVSEQNTLAQHLLDQPRYGGLLKQDHAALVKLLEWQSDLHQDLCHSHDGLAYPPQPALPVLLREFAECLALEGFHPVGACPGQDTHRIGWLKNLTRQGCEVYRRERELGLSSPQDWVPRAPTLHNDLAEAPCMQLPIFFVTSTATGQHQGLNGWLRVWLWPCEGAALEWLPSVPQRVQPLAQSWQSGLEQASTWIRQQMQGQGGDWQNHALVWDVQTSEAAYDLLTGDSASAAFALAGLWLVRRDAPERWRGLLASMTREHWRNARLSAAICAGNTADMVTAPAGNDLQPVGGVVEKSLANWVLSQCSAQRPPPLHVAKAQTLNPVQPGQTLPWIHRHASAFELLQTLAREALNLNPAQAALLAALQPHLPEFAPLAVPAASVTQGNMANPWHLPLHPPPRLATETAGDEAAKRWQQTLHDVVHESAPPAQLVSFALTRWAARASEMHEGGQVHRLFVNLSVSDEHRPRHSAVQAGEPEGFSLEQLLADYEQDSARPAQRLQALQIVGAPGAGKTWLLARFEQACAERLLWQLDWRASQAALTDAAEYAQDPYPYLTVPLYVALSELPASHQTEDEIKAWFLAQVLGGQDAPDSPLRHRLMRPESEPGIRLRILLDGLNELKVNEHQTRQERAKQVVRTLWKTVKPGLVMLLGTRTHHQFELDHVTSSGQTFKAANALLQGWRMAQIGGYLRQRWADEKYPHLLGRVDNILEQLQRDPHQRLREVLSLPLYLRIQCELFEAGAIELLDSRARLLAALLWRKLQQEFIAKVEHGEGRSDPGLLTEQERSIASSFLKNPDQTPPAFPRKGRLLQGLFALAWQMWLAHSDVPVAARGQVALPLHSEQPPDGTPPSMSVHGCLYGLGWPAKDDTQREAWVAQWIEAAKNLGWLTVNPKNQTARFAHQAYGEFLASQQLFWQPRHAGWDRHPQPLDWQPDELAALARQLAPPALERGCLDELEKQAQDADALWQAARLQPLFDTWLKHGIVLDWHQVEAAMPVHMLREQDGSPRRYWRGLQVLEEVSGRAIWRIAQMGDLYQKHGLLFRLKPGQNWREQVSAWRGLLTEWDIWSVFRAQAQRQVAEHLGDEGAEQAERMWQATGHLPEVSPGALDEIMLLALEALPDPLPWLQALLQVAEQITKASNSSPRQTGCWALLSRALVQEAQRLDMQQALPAELRRQSARLLLAVNQAADPELPPHGQAGHPVAAHDLRQRIQAGLCLGQQGGLGRDAGDHVRYEQTGGRVQGVRLRHEHWCRVCPSEPSIQPFLMARYPVTVGEYQAFVDAGGYHNENAPWWLQGLPPEQSAARAWLLYAHGNTKPTDRKPFALSDARFNNLLQPMVALSWYEACAYAHWAGSMVYGDWLAAEALALGVPNLTLRLPTEREWRAALAGVADQGWPGHAGAAEPSPLLFNHLATGWGKTTPVGSFPASQAPGGLVDAAGNQWEWCANNPVEPEESPPNHLFCAAHMDNDTKQRALRGGSYYDTASQCRVGSRGRNAPVNFYNDGLRLVLAVGW